MTAPDLTAEEAAVAARFDAAPPAPESYISAEEAGFDPDQPHKARTYGSVTCTVCGRIAVDTIHDRAAGGDR